MKEFFFLVFGHDALYGVELEMEILWVMAYRKGNFPEDQGYR